MIPVVVPVKNEWHLTARLLDSLKDQNCRVLIIDNGSTDQTAREVRRLQHTHHGWTRRLHRTSRPGWSVYQMWNHGFEWARLVPHRRGPWHVLMTNNDIILPPDALGALVYALGVNLDAWVSYPDYDAPWTSPQSYSVRETRGVLGDGGMLGACFMLAGHRIPWRPLITDLTYEWWYGDNHLAEEIEQHGGKQVRVVGLPVQHVNEGTASKLDPGELWRMKYRDRQRWLNRYERQA